MAGNKKPKKKYIPKKVFIPRLIISMTCFEPIEKAIDQLIETQEIELDEAGAAIYRNPKGEAISFESGINTYTNFVKIYAERTGLQVNLEPLWKLRDDMQSLEGFEEEDLLQAKQCALICKEIIAKIPFKVSQDIVQTLKMMEIINKSKTPIFD